MYTVDIAIAGDCRIVIIISHGNRTNEVQFGL